jgi:hypothetical protein
MLAALPATGIVGLMTSLAKLYGIEPQNLTWQETPEPGGYNDTLRATYQLTIAGPDGRTALQAALWFTLPHGYADALAIVDLSIDFDALIETATSAAVIRRLRIRVASRGGRAAAGPSFAPASSRPPGCQ